MKDEFMGKYVPPFYCANLLTNDAELSKATNPPRSMLPNSMSFSLAIISEACKVTSKSFPNFEMDL